MDIREINLDDIENCAGLYVKTFSAPPWNEDWTISRASERLGHFYHSLGFQGVIAIQDETVAGFVLGNIEPYSNGPIFYLRETCTAAEYQNRGIGTAMLKQLEVRLQLKGVSSIYLVTERDIPAARFYLSRGYIAEKNTVVYSREIS